jgi:hypothetical protein
VAAGRLPPSHSPEDAAALRVLGPQILEVHVTQSEMKGLLDANIAVSRHLERDQLFGANRKPRADWRKRCGLPRRFVGASSNQDGIS